MKKVINSQILEADGAEMELFKGSISEENANTCNGNACGYIKVTATDTGRGCRFINSSDSMVNMSVRFAFGLQCMGPSGFQVPPNSYVDFYNGGYCSPYDANF